MQILLHTRQQVIKECSLSKVKIQSYLKMVWSRRRSACAVPASLLSLLLVWSTDGSPPVAPALAAVPVPVGVVLNLASAMDRRSLTCISIALDDFYLKHPSYTTRVELRVSDSRGDPVAAAAEELMNKNKNDEVKAIITPQTSAEVELFTSLTRSSNTPVLFLSTTAPAFSSPQSRLFVRTAPDMSSQAAPIAAIFEEFGWRAAILLHEDSPYGIGILSALVHAFQGSRSLTDSVAVPIDATNSSLDAALRGIRAMPTRVYIVHMLPALATRLFRRAMVAGMMSEGYVWIATAGVGDVADCLPNHGDIESMQGVLSLQPRVFKTEQVRRFSARLKVKFPQECPTPDDGQSVPVSLLWLYDTAWAAAAAAEVSFGTAQRKSSFLDALLVTKFDGLAGRFRLVDGQRQVSAYEIVNISGKGSRTVGFWTPEFGISTNLYSTRGRKKLKQILWPGKTAAVPTGLSESPPLRVAVPGWDLFGGGQFVNFTHGHDPSSGTGRATGYCIEVFEAAMERLGYSFADYTYVLYRAEEAPSTAQSVRSYIELVKQVYDKKVDAVVGDVTITAARMNLVDFTTPFTDTGYSMIVPKEDSSKSMWIFVKPLTPELWFTSLAFFLFTGFVVWTIEHRINPRFRGTPWKQFGVLFYFAFSTMVFSHKEKLESNLSKLVVIMWVFVVLILTTNYTANLTSMLTVRQLQPTMNDWTESDYVGFQDGSLVEDILKNMGFQDAKFRRYSTMEEYADALRKGSGNGGVSAIFDEVPYLKLFLSRYCEGYSMVSPIYKSGGFGFAFPVGSPLVADVSGAILEMQQDGMLTRIENKWFTHPGACVRMRKDVDNTRLELRRFRGLFLVNAVVSCLMLLIHLATFVSWKSVCRWLRSWLPRLDASEGRGGEPVGNGQGTVELSRLQGLATGAEDQQQAATGDSHSTPADGTDSEGNAASAHVPEEPVGGNSTTQSPHEPAPAVASM
ncbi:hypothetical protein VPH35_121710 [Triticum aestivum]